MRDHNGSSIKAVCRYTITVSTRPACPDLATIQKQNRNESFKSTNLHGYPNIGVCNRQIYHGIYNYYLYYTLIFTSRIFLIHWSRSLLKIYIRTPYVGQFSIVL